MLTKEKRAHDLALVIVQNQFQLLMSSAPSECESGTTIKFDYAAEYMRNYKALLEVFEKSFE